MTDISSASPTLVVGIVNVTPDSFSDGGRWQQPATAVEHGFDLVSAGADMLDIGAESTRPGFEPVPPAEQLRRLTGVLEILARTGVPLSIDTRSAEVAHAAVQAGASVVNDVSGGLHDPEMLPFVAAAGVDYVCQLWRRDKEGPTDRPIWASIRDQLLWRRDECVSAGIDPARIILDPGIGFGRSGAEDWAILADVDRLTDLPHRILIGASRKSFLGPDASPGGDLAITAWCAKAGVWAVRTHTSHDHKQVISATWRLRELGDNHE